ncbi:response regulator transcription factor [Opitutus terrae]|uniref:response regulator transcription factor n=1 Tax=Opitutus terrae TaxID=107709 RepID=UPI0011D0E6D7|nr:response regulator transcription factor [Opitutus terrae]
MSVPAAGPAGTNRAPRPRILLVSDRAPRPESLAGLLVENGYLVFHLPLAADPFHPVLGVRPSLIVSEIPATFRGRDSWLGQLRRCGIRTPILLVSPTHSTADRIQGLQHGADDCLGQPFHPAELLARVQALLRRSTGPLPLTAWVRFGPVVVDLRRMTTIDPRGQSRLSRIECAFLDLLVHARGRAVSRERLLRAIWGNVNPPASRSVDTHVWRLRRKIGDTGHEPHWIKSVPGVGYQLEYTECHISPSLHAIHEPTR